MSNIVEDQMREALADEIRGSASRDYLKAFRSGDDEVDKAFAAPAQLRSTEGDLVTVWDTATGEPRQIPSLMLAKTLKKKRDGKRAFETINPGTGELTGPVPEFKGGTTPCWFNPKSARYAELSAIPGLEGFQCASEKLASEFDAELHAKYRHNRRYSVARDFLDRKEREDDRSIQRQSIEAMMAMAGGSKAVVYACDECDHETESKHGLKIHKGKEHRADA